MDKLCGDVDDMEAPTTFLCKHGVEYGYCITNCIKPSKSISSDYNMGRMKFKNIIHSDLKRQKGKGIKLAEDVKPKKLDTGNVVLTVKEFRIKAATEEPLHTDPAPVASWNDLEAPAILALCKHGVEYGYCITNCSRPSKSLSCNLCMGPLKFKSVVHSDSNYTVKRQKGKGIKLAEDVKAKNSESSNVVSTVKEFYIKAGTKKPFHTDPAPFASWKGSFMLKDDKTRLGFWAHLTSEGYSKVNEISRNMPEVLEFELCLYEDFLWTVFKGCDPDEKDIGLYFFPNDNARPDEYIFLVQKLSRNFLLRSCIDGVELLVFTSKVLRKEYRKRNKSYFLWGLYRHRHGKLKGAVEETMAIDMEVNMVGGEIVGAADVVVPKQSRETNLDIPPGFSPRMRGQWKTKI